MNLAAVGSVAFDAIETPFGKTDKIVGGAGSYIALASSFFVKEQSLEYLNFYLSEWMQYVVNGLKALLFEFVFVK